MRSILKFHLQYKYEKIYFYTALESRASFIADIKFIIKLLNNFRYSIKP